ncbi:MAG: hypothetical protein AB1649_32465, partial [Chloroflexota bacterium]
WEDGQDIHDTLSLLLELPGEFVYCPHILMPFPNSELYRKMIKDFPDQEITYVTGYRDARILSSAEPYFDYNSMMLEALGLWNKGMCGKVPRATIEALCRKYAPAS